MSENLRKFISSEKFISSNKSKQEVYFFNHKSLYNLKLFSNEQNNYIYKLTDFGDTYMSKLDPSVTYALINLDINLLKNKV